MCMNLTKKKCFSNIMKADPSIRMTLKITSRPQTLERVKKQVRAKGSLGPRANLARSLAIRVTISRKPAFHPTPSQRQGSPLEKVATAHLSHSTLMNGRKVAMKGPTVRRVEAGNIHPEMIVAEKMMGTKANGMT